MLANKLAPLSARPANDSGSSRRYAMKPAHRRTGFKLSTTTKKGNGMGIAHIAAAAEIDGITITRKAILFAFAIASNIDGEWKLDRERACRIAGCSPRTLRANIPWLKRNGYLTDLGGDYFALTL